MQPAHSTIPIVVLPAAVDLCFCHRSGRLPAIHDPWSLLRGLFFRCEGGREVARPGNETEEDWEVARLGNESEEGRESRDGQLFRRGN